MADNINLLNSDDTVEFGAEEELGAPKRLVHPAAVAFHLIFKLAAFIVYILFWIVSDNFVLNFVLIMVLLAMDFWTTKNISGRLLVGLRWWNYIDDDGKSHWIYESKQGEQRKTLNASESRIFWAALFITQLIWILYIFVNLFRFNIKWMVVVIIANVLNGANLYGYIKCRVGSGKSIREYASGLVSRRVVSAALSTMNQSTAKEQTNASNSVI